MSAARTADSLASGDFDRAVHASVARLTHGLSPLVLASASADWLMHLGFSPGKQMDLALLAMRQGMRLSRHIGDCMAGRHEPCIRPLPQDRRFEAPQWQQWPFNLMWQAFLLNQQWWHAAATDVSGVSHHHELVVDFASRQALDLVSPSNFLASNPELIDQTLRTGGANLAAGWRNWLEDMARVAADRPPVGTEAFRPGIEVAVTPGEVVFRNHLIELIRYAPMTPAVFPEPVLVLPSWIMKYYILDLSPHNSLVRHLVEHGHAVYMVSWRNPDGADRDLGMDHYLQKGAMAAIDVVWQCHGGRRIHAVGYCLGGTLLAIAAAQMAHQDDHRLCSLSLLASQVDFSEPGELGIFIDEAQLAWLDDLMASQGYLDGKQMAGAFALLNQRDLVFSRMVHDYLMGRRRPVTDLHAWNADATRMPFRQHREYLQSLYHHNDLAQGRYRAGGKPVALSDIHVPVFTLATERDTVSPWRSVYKISLLTDTEVTFCLTSGGHNVGVVNPPGPQGVPPGVSRTYRITTRPEDGKYVDPEAWHASAPVAEGSWWPAWQAWLQQRSSGPVLLDSLPPAARACGSLGAAPGRYVLMP